jgi:hypothetical protein
MSMANSTLTRHKAPKHGGSTKQFMVDIPSTIGVLVDAVGPQNIPFGDEVV